MNKLLHTCRAKLTSRELDGLRNAYRWFVSPQLIILHVKDNSLVWESGSILFNDILEASLEEKKNFLRKRDILLKIKTATGEEYHFEVKATQFWKQELPFKTAT